MTVGAVVREWGVTALFRGDVLTWLRDVVRLQAMRAERLGVVQVFDEGPLDVPGSPRAILAPGHSRPCRSSTLTTTRRCGRSRTWPTDVVVSGHGSAFRGTPAEAVRLALAAA